MPAILSFGPGAAYDAVTLVPIGHVFFAAAFFFCIGMLAGIKVYRLLEDT